MASPLFPLLFTNFLLFLSLSLISLASFPSFTSHPLCHRDEISALLQFKESLITNICDPTDSSSYPKLDSWKIVGERNNCCSWDGVKCDDITGHIVGLDLSNSCLYGSLSFNVTLSQLAYLRHLSLANNNFTHSLIPSMLGHFSHLTYLDLSNSVFSGQIPPSISQLSKLSFLNLSSNEGLMLEKQNFQTSLQNLTGLQYLSLDGVEIPSTILKTMVNFSSLISLSLKLCELYGEFPAEIFHHPNLRYISLAGNSDLGGYLPQFNSSSPLEVLKLQYTRFEGLLPASIGKLRSLNTLDIYECSFSGQVPTSLGNLTQLQSLVLSWNNFGRLDPSTLSGMGKLTKLTLLALGSISLYDENPAYLANITQLVALEMSYCQLFGPFPPWLFKMNNLRFIELSGNELQGSLPDSFSQLKELELLSLSHNNFQGEIPSSVFHLKNLQTLDLQSNNLSRKVEFNAFLKLEKLTELHLSSNHLSLILDKNTNATIRRFLALGLGSCNLPHFPYFLRDQDQLTWLDLSNNKIYGQIPVWIWNTSTNTLDYIDLSHNFLTGFDLGPLVLPWASATEIDLSHNMFSGPLPLPPSTTIEFWATGNNFRGQISPHFCTLSDIYSLVLSNNSLSGKIPPCLGNFSTSLQILDLEGNNFHGSIPQTHTKDCNLKVLILDDNNLKGKVPNSLSNCSRLEFLSLGNNQIGDAFPSWLGKLQELKILILRSNHFHGVLKSHATGLEFPKLHIIDLSQNNLSGPLPTRYLTNWNAMKMNADNGTYLQADALFTGNVTSNFHYSMILTNKGIKTAYQKILDYFVAIDLSGNRFEGHIPICIGSLKGLRLLNLSNNMLTGHIPSSLANLSKLEALDLSQNKLSGEIPQELANLNFLSFFNVSHNQLTGPIPQGQQFDTFSNDSYEGNPGLCGGPLSKNCATLPPPPPPSISEEDDLGEGSPFKFGWMPVAIGFTCGFVVGLGIGHTVYTKKREWVVKIFGAKQRTRKFVRGLGQGNQS